MATGLRRCDNKVGHFDTGKVRSPEWRRASLLLWPGKSRTIPPEPAGMRQPRNQKQGRRRKPMLEHLERQKKLTINQWKIFAAATIGDMLDFFDFLLIAFILAFVVKDWNLT
jgi:hypothetical protein